MTKSLSADPVFRFHDIVNNFKIFCLVLEEVPQVSPLSVTWSRQFQSYPKYFSHVLEEVQVLPVTATSVSLRLRRIQFMDCIYPYISPGLRSNLDHIHIRITVSSYNDLAIDTVSMDNDLEHTLRYYYFNLTMVQFIVWFELISSL